MILYDIIWKNGIIWFLQFIPYLTMGRIWFNVLQTMVINHPQVCHVYGYQPSICWMVYGRLGLTRDGKFAILTISYI